MKEVQSVRGTERVLYLTGSNLKLMKPRELLGQSTKEVGTQLFVQVGRLFYE